MNIYVSLSRLSIDTIKIVLMALLLMNATGQNAGVVVKY